LKCCTTFAGVVVAANFSFEVAPADNAAVDTSCAELAFHDSLITDGIFNDYQGFIVTIAELAKNSPDEHSDISVGRSADGSLDGTPYFGNNICWVKKLAFP
jgi:hypothetical protein